jgi:hypothetical protein
MFIVYEGSVRAVGKGATGCLDADQPLCARRAADDTGKPTELSTFASGVHCAPAAISAVGATQASSLARSAS